MICEAAEPVDWRAHWLRVDVNVRDASIPVDDAVLKQRHAIGLRLEKDFHFEGVPFLVGVVIPLR